VNSNQSHGKTYANHTTCRVINMSRLDRLEKKSSEHYSMIQCTIWSMLASVDNDYTMYDDDNVYTYIQRAYVLVVHMTSRMYTHG
jgi:hypothetical protein